MSMSSYRGSDRRLRSAVAMRRLVAQTSFGAKAFGAADVRCRRRDEPADYPSMPGVVQHTGPF